MARLIDSSTTCHDDAVRRSFALALTAALITGCTLDLAGLPASAGGTSAGGEGGAVSTTSSSNSTSSSIIVSSSGTTTPCTPTGAEICDDEIDNDCNLATDCADPACKGGFVCIPAIPSGWSAVAFSAQDRSACPAGYATAADVVSAPASASCGCTCTEQEAASCSEGTVGLASNGAGACPPSPTFSLNANGSSCGSTDLTTVKNGKVKIAPLPPTQGQCSGSPTNTIMPPVEGRSCDAAAVGAGCADGGACVTSPSGPFVACIAHDGVEPCPAGFPNGHAVGASAADTRSCSSCTCGTSATCSNPKLTLYSDPACTMGAHELPVSNTCDPVNDGNGKSYKSYKYTATITNAECKTTADSTPTGSLVLAGERTVCCQ